VTSSTATEPSRPAPVSSSPPPPSEIGIRPDAFARVATDDLRVRSKPFVGDASRKLEPLLWKGADLFVIDGPVAGSGYRWYFVKPLGEVDVPVHPEPPAYGWVAAGSKDGEAWLEPVADECFDTPLGWLQFDLMNWPMDLSALSCFGDRRLAFTAGLSVRSIDECDPVPAWVTDLAWFGGCQPKAYLLADPNDRLTDETHTLLVWIEPSVDLRTLPTVGSDEWLLVDVVGQFAHPAAASCRPTPNEDGQPESPAELARLACRSQFVVTELKAHVDT
jgi:hypothetical protein